MHVHYLPHLSLSYARHTDALNQTFILLDSDYSKSLHLQTDRSLQFHNPGGLHYVARIPRYGRDLKYHRRTAEVLVPSVGVNSDGAGEVFRLNLEVGRFMKGFEIDVGGDDFTSLGGGALQGGIATGSVNCAAVADRSHGLMAFGTSLGTVELWDARSRNRVSALGPPVAPSMFDTTTDLKDAVTALEFHSSGLNLATGSSSGLIHTYDLRSPVPLMRKDQGYGFPIQTLQYLTPDSASSALAPNKLLTSDRRSVNLYDTEDASLWTSISPAVDLHHVAWVSGSGMLLTANEGRQQHAFFIPQLGPAPRWCSFLDNLVEEMADDTSADPAAYRPSSTNGIGAIYDNYKFVDQAELRALKLEHLLAEGKTNVLRPYMHGYFVPQRLYEEARLVANPDLAIEQRQRSIQEKIDKERESRIRGNKKVAVKVNRKLAEKLAAREEANEVRKARRLLRKQGGDQDYVSMKDRADGSDVDEVPATEATEKPGRKSRLDLMDDDRFRDLFENQDFEIDETSREYLLHNPSSATTGGVEEPARKRGLTAVEAEDLEEGRMGSSDDGEDDGSSDEEAATATTARQRQRGRDAQDADDTAVANGRIGSTNYKKSGHQSQKQRSRDKPQRSSGPRMQTFTSSRADQKQHRARPSKSFGELAATLPSQARSERVGGASQRGLVGEKEVSFMPAAKGLKRRPQNDGDETGRDARRGYSKSKDRRSASGNVFRRM